MVLTDNDLKLKAPAVFAEEPGDRVTDKYVFTKTIDAINAIRDEGWLPVEASQPRIYEKTKDKTNPLFSKHQIIFQRDTEVNLKDLAKKKVEEIVRLILTNGHNGQTLFRLDLGVYTLICSNGLVAQTDSLMNLAMRHYGEDNYINFDMYLNDYIKQIPVVTDRIDDFKAKKLTDFRRLNFASEAIEFHWGRGYDNVTPKSLLSPRRSSDDGSSLWKTYNVVQENLIKGKVDGYNSESGRRLKTRGVTNLRSSMELNKFLWQLAEKYLNN